MTTELTASSHKNDETGKDFAPHPGQVATTATAEKFIMADKSKTKKFVPWEATAYPQTLGEKAHWALTYIGGDWLLNSAIGVSFMYLTSRTALGKKYYIEPITNFVTKTLAPFTKDPQTVEKGVSGGLNFLSIMAGGTAINPILTRLENHKNKKAISKSIDTMIYGKDRVENDPRFQQAYANIDKEPLKGTGSVWISRFIAIAPLITAASIPKAYEFLKSNEIPILKYINFDNIAKFTRTTAEKMGIRPKKMMETVMVNPTTGEKISNWQALHDSIGFDYGLTIFYAILHATAFSAVAKQRSDQREKVRADHNLQQQKDSWNLSSQKEEAALATFSQPDPKVRQITHEKPLETLETQRA